MPHSSSTSSRLPVRSQAAGGKKPALSSTSTKQRSRIQPPRISTHYPTLPIDPRNYDPFDQPNMALDSTGQPTAFSPTDPYVAAAKAFSHPLPDFSVRDVESKMVAVGEAGPSNAAPVIPEKSSKRGPGHKIPRKPLPRKTVVRFADTTSTPDVAVPEKAFVKIRGRKVERPSLLPSAIDRAAPPKFERLRGYKVQRPSLPPSAIDKDAPVKGFQNFGGHKVERPSLIPTLENIAPVSKDKPYKKLSGLFSPKVEVSEEPIERSFKVHSVQHLEGSGLVENAVKSGLSQKVEQPLTPSEIFERMISPELGVGRQSEAVQCDENITLLESGNGNPSINVTPSPRSRSTIDTNACLARADINRDLNPLLYSPTLEAKRVLAGGGHLDIPAGRQVSSTYSADSGICVNTPDAGKSKGYLLTSPAQDTSDKETVPEHVEFCKQASNALNTAVNSPLGNELDEEDTVDSTILSQNEEDTVDRIVLSQNKDDDIVSPLDRIIRNFNDKASRSERHPRDDCRRGRITNREVEAHEREAAPHPVSDHSDNKDAAEEKIGVQQDTEQSTTIHQQDSVMEEKVVRDLEDGNMMEPIQAKGHEPIPKNSNDSWIKNGEMEAKTVDMPVPIQDHDMADLRCASPVRHTRERPPMILTVIETIGETSLAATRNQEMEYKGGIWNKTKRLIRGASDDYVMVGPKASSIWSS